MCFPNPVVSVYRFIPSFQSIVSFRRFSLSFHSVVSFHRFIPSFHSVVSFHRFIPSFHSIDSFHRFIPSFHSVVLFCAVEVTSPSNSVSSETILSESQHPDHEAAALYKWIKTQPLQLCSLVHLLHRIAHAIPAHLQSVWEQLSSEGALTCTALLPEIFRNILGYCPHNAQVRSTVILLSK